MSLVRGRLPYGLPSATLSPLPTWTSERTEVKKWSLITGQGREIRPGSRTNHVAGKHWVNGWV